MKRNLLAFTLALGALLTPVRSHAETEVSFQYFYDNLSPYGEWVQVADYGNCWRPSDVDEDWSPYTDGYWSYTDAGWTWISYEDFGDITYHYGRWIRTADVGWCWVPDTEWGPAWVSWRSSDDYVGWAPLPPEAHWTSTVGFSTWVDDYCDIGPSYYNFCPVVEFSAPVLRHVCVPHINVVNIFAHTVNITNICFNSYNRVPFCGGPNYAFISTRVRQPLPTLKLVQNTTIINNNTTIINNNRPGFRGPRNTVAGNTLNVFAPRVIKNGGNLIQPKVTKIVAKDQVMRGWNGVKDPGEVKQLRAKVKAESKGLTPDSAPARPVQVADLKPVPEKADPQAPSPVARPLNPKRDRNHDGIPDAQQRNTAAGAPGIAPVPGAAQQTPGAGPGKVKGDKNGDGRPDAPVAGTNQQHPNQPFKGGKPERPQIPGQPGQPANPGTQPQPGSTVVDQPPGKGQGKQPHPGKGKKGHEQPDAPAIGINEPTQPQPVQPPVAQPNPIPGTDRGNDLRKPFRGADAPNVNETPARPDAPDREPGAGRGKGKRDQDDQLQRQQQQQRAVELQQQQQEQAQRARQAAEARRQQMDGQREQQGQRERAERQQAQEAQRQQQAAREQQQQAIQAQREQQATRQQAQQEQRERAAQQQQAAQEQRQQAARQQQAMEEQRQRQAERQQRALEAQREMQQQRQQQMQQQQRQQQPQQAGDGKGKGGDKDLTPEEAEALRRAGRGGGRGR